MKEQFQTDKYHPVWPDVKGRQQTESLFANSCWLPMPKDQSLSEIKIGKEEKAYEPV